MACPVELPLKSPQSPRQPGRWAAIVVVVGLAGLIGTGLATHNTPLVSAVLLGVAVVAVLALVLWGLIAGIERLVD